MNFFKYIWINAWIFFAWLIIPTGFILYWVNFETDYMGDVVFTIGLSGSVLIIIVISLYIKWKKK